jgi:hypothetical protein
MNTVKRYDYIEYDIYYLSSSYVWNLVNQCEYKNIGVYFCF